MTALDDGPWDDAVRALAPGPASDAFLAGLPPGYRQQTTPAEAAQDLVELAALAGPGPGAAGAGPGLPMAAMGGEHRLTVRPATEEGHTFRLRRFGPSGIELTSALPLLESFGLVVVESVPYRLSAVPGAPGAQPVHVDDIAIRIDSPYGPEALRFVPEVHGDRLVEAIDACSGGHADTDSLNRLVTAAGLDWHQVTVLRAYLRYWMQAGIGLPWDELTDPLVEYPDVARALIGYFQARFDPGVDDHAEAPARSLCEAQLDLVSHLDQDRVLRGILGLIDASLRTNFYRPGHRPGSPLVLKLLSGSVPALAPPKPLVEAFVHGPTVEGIHVRAGLIARGGLRWSERPADFRTEVLDLAFAQVKKNAIIVPTGAKGGFVCRRPALPHPGGGARLRPALDEVRAAYELFVSALLEITDNLAGGEIVTPAGVRPADGADPYLVVAADKGTATFSDLANAVSERFGFWLGDAFASGGSRGYDHKAMGITARGAWVAVRRHFRELGIDVAADPVTVVGVGDMSGDVFGNGMLQSRSIRLVAAFDHRHVFLDPDPDPGVAFEERRRLAGLASSSWADYRTELISAGGGVWGRDTKLVPLSEPVRAALGVADDQLSPPRLISAVLGAPVDLLWFGGIGTYVKAPDEADSLVGDHANDAVRVTSDQVRARVIAEGANLGVTQRARIRYSRRGGRINADFIDNAAGVATSDREVNLKVLLALAAERGRLDGGGRDEYLARSEDEVAAEVLRQVDHSVAALNRAAAGSERLLDAYESLVDDLEASGQLDREVEVLPDRTEFQRRREAGAGLIRPELATILAYAKSDLVAALEASPSVGDPVFVDSVTPYFPAPIRADFADLVPDHRLYPRLVATDVAGEVVDQLGVVWAHDLAAELGYRLDEVATAFWVARQAVGAGELWNEIEAAAADPSSGVDAATEAERHRVVADAVADLARYYLTSPSELPDRRLERSLRAAEQAPVPPAERFGVARARVALIMAADVAAHAYAGCSTSAAAAAVEELARVARLDHLHGAVHRALGGSPPPGRLREWQARALLDDLGSFGRRAAADALGTAGPGVDAVAAVGAWRDRHGDRLDRAAALVASQPDGSDPLAVVSLALRRLVPAVQG